MADPRLDVSIVGIGAVYATFLIDNSTVVYLATSDGGAATVGRAVNLSAANTIQLAADGKHVLGKLCQVFSDNTCTVQIKGGMTLPGGNGASLTLGKSIVGAASVAPANGYIREVATATAAELGLMRGVICDAGTTTAVEVYL
jgi:hypothetical protein